LTVPVCAVVVEITTKRTFIQLVFLKAGLGTLQPMKAVFQNVSIRPKTSASVVTYLIYSGIFESFKREIEMASITVSK